MKSKVQETLSKNIIVSNNNYVIGYSFNNLIPDPPPQSWVNYKLFFPTCNFKFEYSFFIMT